MIDDETELSQVTFTDTKFDIISGSAYYSEHILDSDITIKNISITTAQLNVQHYQALLYFASADTVKITNMNLIYEYDTKSSCYEYETKTNALINASCSLFYCTDPIMAIYNSGQVSNIR